MKKYPENTKTVIRWDEIIRREKTLALSERMSSRMIKTAALLPEGEFVGWQMETPKKGLARIESFGSAAVRNADLEWITEESAKTTAIKGVTGDVRDPRKYAGWKLYEILLAAELKRAAGGIGFTAGPEKQGCENRETLYNNLPASFSTQFGELIRALREEGALFRFTAGRASLEEQKACEKYVASAWNYRDLNMEDYIGAPVSVKVLLMLAEAAPVRLRAVISEAAPGTELKYIADAPESRCLRAWENPLGERRVMPDIAARILVMEPVITGSGIVGVESCLAEVKPVQASHKNSSDKRAVTIGRAVSTSGLDRKITIADADIRRHWQIVGQTGTGKSTLIAKALSGAIAAGRGVTFFDPHGTTIDILLKMIPEKYADRVRVARFGDAGNPIPVSMWDSDDPADSEKAINDMNQLFMEIFDPNHRGFLGPRWERWFSTFASAAISLLGRNASFESIITASQSTENMLMLYRAIRRRDPVLARTIKSEYGQNESSDFRETINWCVSKFQRLTSVPQLRKTLGAGINAIDFGKLVDTDAVTLIDLASPTMGAHAARSLGTLLMFQLWNALTSRQKREMTHIVAVDEAHLFQNNLQEMLATGRKFGLAMILAHQHYGQLTEEIRDALDANSANFSAFRLSVKDSADASVKLDDPYMRGDLSRLNAFNAMTTLSVDGKQTPAFTLKVEKPVFRQDSDKVARQIEENSIAALVTPFHDQRALTSEEILRLLEYHSDNPLPPRKQEGPPRKQEGPARHGENLQLSQAPPDSAGDPRAPEYISRLAAVLRYEAEKRDYQQEEEFLDEAV